MRITLIVTYNDGTAVDATATTADLVAFEDEFDRSIARIERELRLKDLCWIAWHSLSRQSLTAHDFGTWLNAVEDVQIEDTEVPVPLEPGTASISE